MDYTVFPHVRHDRRQLTEHAGLLKAQPQSMIGTGSIHPSEATLAELAELTGKASHVVLDADSITLKSFIQTGHNNSKLSYCLLFSVIDAGPEYLTERAGTGGYELRFTISGEGTLDYMGKHYTLHAGEGFFISCSERHRYRATEKGWCCTVASLNGPICEDVFRRLAETGSVKFSTMDYPLFEQEQYALVKLTQSAVPYADLQISSAIDALLIRLLVAGHKQGKRGGEGIGAVMERIIPYINEHFREPLEMEALAHMFGLGHTMFFREFKKYTGSTPGSYVQTIRINTACGLLRDSALSVEQVSAASGFSDPGHFSQIFKKRTGQTPLQYRRFSAE